MHVYAYTNYQLLDVRFVTRNFSYTPFYGIRAQMTRHDNTDETPFAGFYFPVLFLIVLIQIFKMRFTRQDFENFFWQWTDGNLYPPHIRCATFSLHRMIAPPPRLRYQPDFPSTYCTCFRKLLHCLPIELRFFFYTPLSLYCVCT